ncbi:unnamed protein product [Symbiodinium natans]|uniref:Uncharacterized protein n=1 Tax=Symbiodinium natans TaxID=878477 RepID=A0A812ST65_9DINO|nr:unnamed protein product [Symbiodinium natans]
MTVHGCQRRIVNIYRWSKWLLLRSSRPKPRSRLGDAVRSCAGPNSAPRFVPTACEWRGEKVDRTEIETEDVEPVVPDASNDAETVPARIPSWPHLSGLKAPFALQSLCRQVTINASEELQTAEQDAHEATTSLVAFDSCGMCDRNVILLRMQLQD